MPTYMVIHRVASAIQALVTVVWLFVAIAHMLLHAHTIFNRQNMLTMQLQSTHANIMGPQLWHIMARVHWVPKASNRPK